MTAHRPAQDLLGDAQSSPVAEDSQAEPATRWAASCEFCDKAATSRPTYVYDFGRCLRCRARWWMGYGNDNAHAPEFVKRGLEPAEVEQVRAMVREMRGASAG